MRSEGLQIERLDHLVLTVTDVERSCAFYRRVLGMRVVRFGAGRTALAFGEQKINLHLAGSEIVPHAAGAAVGSADLCLITRQAPAQTLDELRAQRVAVELGPVTRDGALGEIVSIYIRDPDGNLLEIACY